MRCQKLCLLLIPIPKIKQSDNFFISLPFRASVKRSTNRLACFLFVFGIISFLFLSPAFAQKKYINAGDKQFKLGQYQLALDNYEKALNRSENEKDKALANEKIAAVHFELHEFATAESYYSSIQDDDYTDVKSLYNYAQTLLFLGDLKRATTYFNLYLSKQSGDREAQQLKRACEIIQDSTRAIPSKRIFSKANCVWIKSSMAAGDDEDESLIYEWNFDEHGYVEGREIEHCFGDTGTYKASLKIIDKFSGKVKSSFDTLIIVKPETYPATFESKDKTKINQGLKFYAGEKALPKGKAGVQYLWMFGDGRISLGQTTSHSFMKEGNYNVKLYVFLFDGTTEQVYSCFKPIHVYTNYIGGEKIVNVMEGK